jgi:SAM-dependent methyltransferase
VRAALPNHYSFRSWRAAASLRRTLIPIHPPRVDEPAAVRARYARRAPNHWRYSLLNPSALLPAQERQRRITDLLVRLGWTDVSGVRLSEVGCGGGANLLELLRIGFAPENLHGIELLESRAEQARRILPEAVRITTGDASVVDWGIPTESLDIAFQSTVFSSLLDDEFQHRLAATRWRFVRPGGGVLWYDFTFDNPINPDVRGVPVTRIRELFPEGVMKVRRVTLAPPLARVVTAVHPHLYHIFNACPFLRTHALGWIGKPAVSAASGYAV